MMCVIKKNGLYVNFTQNSVFVKFTDHELYNKSNVNWVPISKGAYLLKTVKT